MAEQDTRDDILQLDVFLVKPMYRRAMLYSTPANRLIPSESGARSSTAHDTSTCCPPRFPSDDRQLLRTGHYDVIAKVLSLVANDPRACIIARSPSRNLFRSFRGVVRSDWVFGRVAWRRSYRTCAGMWKLIVIDSVAKAIPEIGGMVDCLLRGRKSPQHLI